MTEYRQRVAILVSANKYVHMRELEYCDRDSDLLRHHLLEYCDYEDANIHQIRLGADQPSAGLESSSGREMARQAFFSQLHSRLLRYADSTAPQTFLFYFAGHGAAHSGRSYMLLPESDCSSQGMTETTAVPIYAIGDALRAKANGAPIFRILDACHSGQFSRDRSPESASPESNSRGNSFLTAIKGEKSNWSTLAACSELNVARESDQLRHGIYTYHICDAIMKSPPGEIYFADLHRRVSTSICDWRHEYKEPVSDPVHIERTEGPPSGFAQRKPNCDETCMVTELPFDIGPSLAVEEPLILRFDEKAGGLTIMTPAPGGIKMSNRSHASIPLAALSDATIYLTASVLHLSFSRPEGTLVAEKIFPARQVIKFRLPPPL